MYIINIGELHDTTRSSKQ